MNLGQIRRRGVSNGSLSVLMNPVRAALWRLLLPWFEGIVESFGGLEKSIVPARSGLPDPLLSSAAPATAPNPDPPTLTKRMEEIRIDMRALAYRLASIEERLALPETRLETGAALGAADPGGATGGWLEEHQNWLSKLSAANAVLTQRVEQLEALPIAAGTGEATMPELRIVNCPPGRFLINPNDLIGRVALRGEEWEPHVARTIEQYADPKRVAIDVGAYIGLHTVRMAKLFQSVFAFEPQPEIFRVLCDNLALNGCDNVQPLMHALFDHDCPLRLAPDEIQDTKIVRRDGQVDYAAIRNAAALAFEPEEAGAEQHGPTAIIAKTLDSLNIQNVGFIKIDAQGADLRVMRGASETIARSRPVIAFEFERELSARHGDTMEDIHAFFESLNYEVRLSAALRDDAQADYLAVPK